MYDDLSTELASAVSAESEGHQPDLAWVVNRGRRVRRLRRLLASGGMVLLITAGAVGVNALQSNVDPRPIPQLINPATPEVQEPQPGEVVEDIPEQYQAEVFAFRAVAANGLMQLDGRAYLFTYEDDTTQTEDGWRVGFAASDCDRSTCRGLSGEDPETGNAETDTYVIVALTDGHWEVVGTEGNFTRDAHEALLGYSLPDRREPSHWDATALTVSSWPEGPMIQMMPLWVGPYPTAAPGSVCRIDVSDSNGNVVEKSVSYLEPPNREFERGGWIRGMELDGVSADSSVTITCRQYTGRGWEVAAEPKLITDPRGVVGMGVDLVWRGDEGFTTGVRCSGTLLDEDGDVVFEGSGRAEPLWRPGELKNYPYTTTVVITTRGEPVDADAVGEFACRSL